MARKLCPQCKQPHQNVSLLNAVGIHDTHGIYQAQPSGCNECNSGYAGRIGIYEVMAFNQALVDALLKRAGVNEIESIAIANGMSTLKQSGIEKLKQGVTSLDELQRVLHL
ncbi:type IV fimbrial assembly ATPase PilB [Vibrio astriarenae]|nr:type IV fimbrial assembly ATPase PilB [Vibrio sp. C7]